MPSLALWLLIAGCSTGTGGSSSSTRSTADLPRADTPASTDRIWQVEPGRFIGADTLFAQARASRILLLGETHDNLAHHAWQNRLLTAIAEQWPPPVLLMEQFDLEQQAAIDAIQQSATTPQRQAAALGALMPAGWDQAGYAPLLETATRLRLPIMAGNLPRSVLRSVSRDGFAALGPGEAQRLGLTGGTQAPIYVDWQPAQQDALEKDIIDSHCGMLPASAAGAIARAQRARDAVLADRILAASHRPGRPAVVAILGRGHARRDLAVPLYLARRAPQVPALVIDLDEAGPGQEPTASPAQLTQAAANGPLGRRYDVVIVSPPVVRAEDPCAGLTAPREKTTP